MGLVIITGNTASERQENIPVNGDTKDQDFTSDTSSNNIVTNEIAVNVKTLARCFIDRIDSEMSYFVDTVEDIVENAFLTDIDNIVAPKIELAIRSKNASSAQDEISVALNSERW